MYLFYFVETVSGSRGDVVCSSYVGSSSLLLTSRGHVKRSLLNINIVLLVLGTSSVGLQRISDLFVIRYLASRTFTHRTLAHNWYFIDPCQVKRPF